MKNTNVLTVAGIGEILWDVLEDSETLGGAPVNFAYHANSLGAKGCAISSVGNDRRGQAALACLADRGMSTDYISVLENAVTGYVVARVNDEGVASYHFPDDVAWDHLTLNLPAMALAPVIDGVCFGSLGQRSTMARRAIFSFLRTMRPDALKIFDLNLRQDLYTRQIIEDSLEIADVLKLNDEELHLLADMDNMHGDEHSLMHRLVEYHKLQLAVLTRGNRGSLLVSPREFSDHGGYHSDIVDTIGAGDSFTAATTLGLLSGWTMAEINDHANRVAAFVCSRQGAMPELPESLREFRQL